LAPASYKPVVLNASTAMALRHGALKLDKSFGSPTCPWRISSADDLMLTQKQNIILKKTTNNNYGNLLLYVTWN
jgi:hypothetical protein